MINVVASCAAPDNVISKDFNNTHYYREITLCNPLYPYISTTALCPAIRTTIIYTPIETHFMAFWTILS